MTSPARDGEAVCPHCSEPINIKTLAALANDARFAFIIKPAPGQLMSAKAVGGTIAQMSKLYDAIAKDLGQKVHLLIEKIATDDDGTIRVGFLIATPDPRGWLPKEGE